MRKKITILIIGVLAVTSSFSQECDKLLESGLYSITQTTNTGNLSADLRTYFLSKTFESDMKSGKWGGSLAVPINGIPFALSANDDNKKFSEFRNEVMKSTSIKIDASNAQSVLQTVPNTNLYQAYVDCVNATKNIPGFSQGTNIETEENVVFTIRYSPVNLTDPVPVVTHFSVVPAGSVISGELKTGDKIESSTLLITCQRPIDKDVIITLNTNRGSIISKSSGAETLSSNKEMPIGTILSSFLNFDQFNLATKNHDKSSGIFLSNKSKWSPCDGRPVPNSKFKTISSQNNVPDLRGVFLRGLNSFDPYQPVKVVLPENGDPENRIVGSFQADLVGTHSHKFEYITPADNDSKGGSSHHKVADGSIKKVNETEKSSGLETRPKNVAVYYYIKIN